MTETKLFLDDAEVVFGPWRLCPDQPAWYREDPTLRLREVVPYTPGESVPPKPPKASR